MNADALLLGGAFLSGLMGSAHCALMCGGIATGFSARNGGGWLVAAEPNLGRVLGYAFAGLVGGGLGHGIVSVMRWPALTLGARAAAGLVLVVAALRLFDRRGRLAFLKAPSHVWHRWLSPLRSYLPVRGHAGRLLTGVFWGWLPCGLSATVLFAAWLQLSALRGATLMLFFGLGTLPVMVPLTWSGARLGQRLQQGSARVALGSVILAAGLITMLAPWLVHLPHVHGALRALGCSGVD